MTAKSAAGVMSASLVLLGKSAVERVRAARAPLIHQHDVALALDACEGPAAEHVEIARRLPGPAGQNEKRIGRGARGRAPEPPRP